MKEQKSENDNLKEIFTKKNENWYEIVLQEMKKLNIKKNENLITCEWSYWITCYNNKCEKYHKIKKKRLNNLIYILIWSNNKCLTLNIK